MARAQDLDGKTELDRNIGAVSRILAQVPASSKVTVIGVTDRSFSQPYVLLAAEIDPDEGYLHERLAAARQQLAQGWQKRSVGLVTRFQQTDLLGSLVVASQLFEARTGWRNVLVLLSDMRHETKTLNLAKPATIPVDMMLAKAEANHLIANLSGVEVYVLGVDGSGKDVAYWNSLRQFWVEYFKKGGASLRTYSMLREMPELPR